ncbi:exosortase family protein XrtM [Oxalobacteraceae bacterium GrIS 1.18]
MPNHKNNLIAHTKFIALFALVFVLQYILYFYIPDMVLINNVYHDFLVVPVTHAINLLFPSENAYALANTIRSSKVDLEVVRGCDGSGLLFLLEAAIIVFPSPIKRKLLGAVLAILFVCVLNFVRIIILFYAASFQPTMFQPLHSFYIPTLLIALSAMFFYAWSMRPSNETI